MSFFWVLNPVLALYGFGTISLFDIFLLLFLPYGVLWRFTEARPGVSAFYLLVICSVLLSVAFNTNEISQTYLRAFRLLLYLVSLFLFSSKFDVLMGKSVLRFLASFASAFIVYQYFCYHLLGFYPRGFLQIQGIEVLRTELIDHALTAPGKFWFRPRSIFGEPSQFAIVIGLHLFTDNNIKLVRLLFLFFSLLLSGSGLGVVVMMLVILFKTSVRLRGFILLSSVAFFILFNLEPSVFLELVKRGWRRLVMFSELNSIMSSTNMIFGKGTIGPSAFTMWPNGFVLNFYYFGFFGAFLWSLFYLRVLKEAHGTKKYPIAAYLLILIFSTELIVSQLLLLVLPFIYRKSNENSLDY